MKTLSFDYKKALSLLCEQELDEISKRVEHAHSLLTEKTGAGSDFLGWLTLPEDYDAKEVENIKKAAKKIQETADVLVVIGIGGSYLGAKAAIDFLGHNFYNLQTKPDRKTPQILFAGNSISPTYLKELCELLEDKEICINVISKSGTTTEPAIAFRVLKELLEKKYGKEAAKERIYVTTDQVKGALRTLADREGYTSFIVPDDIGGRYSVLSAVGLLPIAVSGADIDEMLQGALDACVQYKNTNLKENPCYQYAAVRNLLYQKGKTLELLVNYEPKLHYFAEWWKQLYGESEGKDHKGIFPAAVDYSTDLHSLGQYVQDGLRNLFETVLYVENPACDILIPEDPENLDGLNYIAGKPLSFVNQKACEGTALAHVSGEVPNLMITIPELSAYYFGQLVYFFEKACGISGYLLGVNPFDQPGVEDYKRNMFALLGKPGYEQEKETLEKELSKFN